MPYSGQLCKSAWQLLALALASIIALAEIPIRLAGAGASGISCHAYHGRCADSDNAGDCGDYCDGHGHGFYKLKVMVTTSRVRPNTLATGWNATNAQHLTTTCDSMRPFTMDDGGQSARFPRRLCRNTLRKTGTARISQRSENRSDPAGRPATGKADSRMADLPQSVQDCILLLTEANQHTGQ